MSAHKRDPRQEEANPLLEALTCYRCTHCSRALEIELVMSADVERQQGLATGYVAFEHFCPCTPNVLLGSRNLGSHPSFLALFGTTPTLPYRAPFRYRSVAEDDATIVRWRWELAQVADFHDFMLFAEDAARTD